MEFFLAYLHEFLILYGDDSGRLNSNRLLRLDNWTDISYSTRQIRPASPLLISRAVSAAGRFFLPLKKLYPIRNQYRLDHCNSAPEASSP